ncbi:histidine phosphatase family protein [Enterococcus sp. LJL120]
MTKTLYLMRHGETLFNVLNKIQGSCDSPLTEKGISQAQAAARYFSQQEIVFDHAYCSTQERASDTLEIVTDQSYQRLKGIKEMSFGAYEGERQLLQPMPHEKYSDYYQQFGGETIQELRTRVSGTLTSLMEMPDYQSVLAVSHSGAIYSFLSYISGDYATSRTTSIPNAGIIQLTFADGKFTVVEIIDPSEI